MQPAFSSTDNCNPADVMIVDLHHTLERGISRDVVEYVNEDLSASRAYNGGQNLKVTRSENSLSRDIPEEISPPSRYWNIRCQKRNRDDIIIHTGDHQGILLDDCCCSTWERRNVAKGHEPH